MTNKQLALGFGAVVLGGLLVGYSLRPSTKAPTVVTSTVATDYINETTNTTGEVTVAAPKEVTTLVASPNSTLLLFGEVGFENSEALASSIVALNQQNTDAPIVLAIDSPGGSVFGGAKVISAIEGSRRPVFTVCVGICASMGAMIHSYGHERLVLRKSTLMYHNAAGGLQGEVPQMETRLNYIKGYVNKISANVAKRSGITLAQYDLLIAHELWIEGEDAVARHFADKVINLDLSKVPNSQGIGLGLKVNSTEETIKDNTGIVDFIKNIGM